MVIEYFYNSVYLFDFYKQFSMGIFVILLYFSVGDFIVLNEYNFVLRSFSDQRQVNKIKLKIKNYSGF